MLIGSRAIQGIGAALMMPATLSIITHAFPAAERGKAIGIWAGVSALALSIGPVVGGFLTEYVSWRAIFFINLPVAVAAVVATVFAVRESRDETIDRRVDYPGVIRSDREPHGDRPRPDRGQQLGLELHRDRRRCWPAA